MAYISRYPFYRHLRVDPSRHIMYWKNGKLTRSGRGLAFWFFPLSASLAELPCDDRELPFVFHARTADYQDVMAQGAVTWHVVDPELLAKRLDFSIDLDTGAWCELPLEQLAEIVSGRAQQYAWTYLASRDVRSLVSGGVEALRECVEQGLAQDQPLADMGIAIVAVAVNKVAPTSDLERALQTPALESIQQQADEAMFERRALAVEKERAIAENELKNQIELATREADLIAQRGANNQQRAREEAAASRVSLEASTEATRLEAAAQAESIRVTEGAHVASERDRIQIYENLDPHVMMGLAMREFAGKLQKIDHLNLTPDMLGTLFGDLIQAGTGLLNRSSAAEGEARGAQPEGA